MDVELMDKARRVVLDAIREFKSREDRIYNVEPVYYREPTYDLVPTDEPSTKYEAAVQAVKKHLKSSDIMKVYLSDFPHKEPGVLYGTITIDDMAEHLVAKVLAREYLVLYSHKLPRVIAGFITPEDMADDVASFKYKY